MSFQVVPVAFKLRFQRLVLALSAIFFCASALQPAFARGTAAIVLDANTGKVLHESQADAPRYPASVTKVMTLYLLFEQIERGRFTLNSRLKVSDYAAQKPPSKLGLKSGSEIEVEDAILSLVTRSANDAATVIAENISGSEYAFARLMTRKANAIGMSDTTFRNASGLPDPEQKTTARDLALLGRALYERFPEYTHYFSTRSFTYRGKRIGNHNRLLGRVTGVDGIKTGYTRASGFNLLTSAHYGGRHVVAVVLGGRTGAQRDAKMASLIASYMPRAAAKKVVDKQLLARLFDRSEKGVALAAREGKQKKKSNEVTFAQAADAIEGAANGKVLALAPPAQSKKSLADIVGPAIAASEDDPGEEADGVPAQYAADDGDMKWQVGAQSTARDDTVTASLMPSVPAAVMPNGQPARPAAARQESKQDNRLDVSQESEKPAFSGWIVQIAATSTEDGAYKLLSEAKGNVKRMLSDARPFTERVVKGNSTFYRARFGGFTERKLADAACAALKQRSYSCLTLRL